jgi:hypothetical protein
MTSYVAITGRRVARSSRTRAAQGRKMVVASGPAKPHAGLHIRVDVERQGASCVVLF